MTHARVPTGTYRLQLRREFGFHDAAAIVPYLADLGVSHVYCSPILTAVPGSAHGYDVVDHSRLNDDLGGVAGWRALVDACRAHGLGIVVDIVPNHMSIPEHNDAFADVLANGSASSYASWFDIDWSQHGGRVLLPFLPAGEPDEEHEYYVCTDWRRGNTELNYRRFFDVTSLIGLRVEDADVFTATHELIGELVQAGDIEGLRVDHPDGLADPRGYLESLEKLSGGVWTVVEKILEGDEQLPSTWACDGTTGYDAIGAITRVLVDPAGAEPLTDFYAEFTGSRESFHEIVVASKRQAIDELFGAEIARLARDHPRDAIVELLVHFPVYRTYDGEYVDEAAQAAKQVRPDLSEDIDAVTRALRTDEAFATRFAQTSGPVTAKGVEDTAFYRYSRLLALNEVGGDPGRFGASVDDFHAFCTRIAGSWPATMTALSTHDTKRSEDVRARLAVLAEIPADWAAAVRDWGERTAPYGRPDRETEYLFWQTLVGAFPISADRLEDYLRKAVREAKRYTTWLDPDDEYERRLSAYAREVLGDDALMAAISDWIDTHVTDAATSNSLAQKLIQLTMPGVPDVYQGQELPDFSLVDPDNRRPVDYDARRRALDTPASEPKLLVTTRALRLRRERPETFAGSYEPPPESEHAVAFVRGGEVITVATRLPVGLRKNGGWGDARLNLPPGRWRDVLTDRSTDGDLADLLDPLPVALLVKDTNS
ncbi:MAG: (1-_4)-alpha-D-glucan 1-alpha-D-glucosylmutase [Frankiaceae bacterium]|jgi:(1->4)-alpha-D-glucan 1-alpha-D-glucosylmutase|nr:(1->4)-alpha-D-glucan 1-alpha-D-glucosylmutase [Frankiaceae bacterium]